MTNAPISHVWFDVAGTLYQESVEFTTTHDQLRYDTYAQLKGITDMDKAKTEFLALLKQHGSHSAVFRALGQPADFWARALDTVDFIPLLRPDIEVTQTLTQIKKHVPISLMTNFEMVRARDILNALEIPLTDFTHFATGDEFKERKPALDGFRLLLAKTGLPAERILYVGDRVKADILPAKEMGFQTALVYSESAEADYCFATFPEILSLFETK